MAFLFIFMLACCIAPASPAAFIGINYGRLADNLPPFPQTVSLIQSLNFGMVKIFDADPQILSALSNTGLHVAIAVTNQELPSLASSLLASDQWILQNVVSHYPSTLINIIVVGNEVLSDYNNQELWIQLLPAMHNLHTSLCKYKLCHSIKISTASALSILSNSFPPSSGCFRSDIAASILQPMLHFLTKTRSYFFINAYPYLTWSQNSQNIPLQYALLANNVNAVQDGDLHYTDLLDAQLDAVVAAMSQLGYPYVKLAISETGWPTCGDQNQPGANIPNAAFYNQRLVNKMLAYPPLGTPRRPRTFIPTYIFALFNEDQKPGPTTERNWGLLYPNGSQVYTLDLSGKLPESQYSTNSTDRMPQAAFPPISPALSPPLDHPKRHHNHEQKWCVSNPDASPAALQEALDYACGQATHFCQAIQPNQPCFQPMTLQSHASYAFSMYWQAKKAVGGTCDFNGSAILTSTNPSYGACQYP